jgi:hypothetical protein
MSDLDDEERELANIIQSETQNHNRTTPRQSFASSSSFITPRPNVRGSGDVEMGTYRDHSDIEEEWAEEAAAAEEAEREAEEMAMLDRVEREYAESQQHGGGHSPSAGHQGGTGSGKRGDNGGMDIDWDGFDQMDME